MNANFFKDLGCHCLLRSDLVTSLKVVKLILDPDTGSDHQLVQAKIKLKFKAKQKSAPVKLINSDKLITDQNVADHFQQAVHNSITAKEINSSTDVNNDTWHTLKDSLLEGACKELGYCNSKKDKWTSEKNKRAHKITRKKVKNNRDNIQDDTSVYRSITKKYNIINRMVKKSVKKR